MNLPRQYHLGNRLCGKFVSFYVGLPQLPPGEVDTFSDHVSEFSVVSEQNPGRWDDVLFSGTGSGPSSSSGYRQTVQWQATSAPSLFLRIIYCGFLSAAS